MEKKSNTLKKKDKKVDRSASAKKSVPKETEVIPPEITEEILAQIGFSKKDLPKIKSMIRLLHYEGIFPPPGFLKGYEEVLPGAADRIFKLTENNADQRIKRETKKLAIESRNSLLGLVFGFIIAVAFLSGAVYLTVKGYPIPGTLLGTLDIVSLVSVFVIGTKSKQKEKLNKLKELIKEQAQRSEEEET
jgi:uncharacterized membrane protein